ncbi:MAG: cell division protein FtsK [Actinobacteria bacterium]|nr:cell division protein FtsK [Actinomycetota bacterium]
MDPADTIVLPAAPAEAPRGSLPMLAAIVPVVSGIVLFVVTGSVFALCFAALGPVMILGSFLDGVRQRRRALRVARAEEAKAWAAVEADVAEREAAERTRRRRAVPDAGTCLADAPLRAAVLAPATEIAVGRGAGVAVLRFSGAGERAEAFRAAHRTLPGVPLAVPLDDGVCVRGPEPLAAAVARALVLQLCLRHANGAIGFTGDGIAAIGLAGLPQAHGLGHDAAAIHVASTRFVSSGPRLCVVGPAVAPPPGYRAVLDVTEPGVSRLRTATGSAECAVSGISAEQAEALARDFAAERGSAGGIPAAVALGDVLAARAASIGGPVRAGLAVALGCDADGPVTVDLVGDGPHAIVTGVTGAGKSELLVSWVAAIAAAHAADEVSFVLADFKGGTAFEPLRRLPHVAAIITDLDAAGAERGVRSLRAELRRREALLSDAGARSIDEATDVLARLVIVVDEFAALLQEHPELGAVFTDIAARGRALGMHLILGTQRATGVIRDALAMNCPLRIALRVTDPADSRAMIGTDAAAGLPGDAAGRGLAHLRRPQDATSVVLRIARTGVDDLDRIVECGRGAARARSPWTPVLPTQLHRAALSMPPAGAAVLGLADEPEQQRQIVRLLRIGTDRGLMVFGGPASGKSSVVRALAEQVPGAVLVPQDPEHAWTIVDELAEGRRDLPPLLAVDDADRLIAAFPPEYASAWIERLHRLVRRAADCGSTVVLTATRCSGQLAALADQLPERALLRASSRSEHLTAGGDTATWDPSRPPGRAVLGATELQFALAEDVAPNVTGGGVWSPADAHWDPRSALVGVVSTTPQRTADQLRGRFGAAAVQILDGAQAAPGASPLVPTGDAAVRSAAGRDGLAADDGGLLLLVGDSDAWQRQYALWQRVQRQGEVVVLAEAARDLRMLAGVRELPPYAMPYAGRAWTVDPDGRPVRVVLTPAPPAPISPAAPRAA